MINRAMPEDKLLIPDDFVEQVKDALSNLYNIPELLKTSLNDYHASDNQQSSAHRLRRELVEAIESMNPGKSVSMRSNVARLYNLMHLHYVGDMTLQETAHELGISQRQAYRDLRRGQENIASILWHNRQHSTTPLKPAMSPSIHEPMEATKLSSIESEITRIERNFSNIDITSILRLAIKAVQQLADQKGIQLDVILPDEPVHLSTNKAIAQQILINLLSQTIQRADTPSLIIQLTTNDHNAELKIGYSGTTQHDTLISPVIIRLMEQVRWSSQSSDTELRLHLNGHGARVLIIDDNEGLVDLLHHYISTNVYQVYTAHNGIEGLKIASSLQPDAIIMDLMMPDMDGWELLQHLRTHADTRNIPVIICSVIHDPELAYSLGADDFIAKPVNKDQILNALKKLDL